MNWITTNGSCICASTNVDKILVLKLPKKKRMNVNKTLKYEYYTERVVLYWMHQTLFACTGIKVKSESTTEGKMN